MALHPDFELSIASPNQMDEVMHVMETAYRNDAVWKIAREKCDDEKVHKWVMKWLAPRYTAPDMTTYIIKHRNSGIVAWTGLQFPWKWRTEKDDKVMTPEIKKAILEGGVPKTTPEGMFIPALIEFWASFEESSKYGYDIEEDYHRKGTMVHPDFQKMGLGSALTQYANDIMDKNPARTWVAARPTSVKMFRHMGFKDVGVMDSELERWGGTREDSFTYILRRDP